MTTSTNEISCYSTHLLLKYAHKKHLKEIDRGITTSLEKLDNPQEWTDAATWTKLAHNIECALGEHEGILSEIAKEIFLHEVNAFIPFFFRIAPERLILKYVTKYVQKYSNKNLDITIDVINNHKWLATMRPIIPARYSRQMCDFNKGWTYATIAIKGLRNFKINEKTCAARENASACIYELDT